MTEFIAHKTEKEIQSLLSHLENTANGTQSRLESVGLSNMGRLIGLLHDMGKYTQSFQSYIRAEYSKVQVIHSTAGLEYMWERKKQAKDNIEKHVCELIGFAVAAHHGQMDCMNNEGKSGFVKKIENEQSEQNTFFEAKKNFESECRESVDDLYRNAVEEYRNLCTTYGITKNSFRLGLLARLLLSAVIDSDRRDAEDFMTGTHKEENCLETVFEPMLTALETRLAEMNRNRDASTINRVRQNISEQCKNAASKESGIYRLSLPTGSGKTLSSLRFALSHCLSQGKKRVFYIAPLLTVIDQNAQEILSSVGKENERYVLEHTSDVAKSEMTTEELSRYDLLTEDWDAPIVVTTLV